MAKATMHSDDSKPNARPLRMLIVDDDPAQEVLIRAALADHSDRVQLQFYTHPQQCLEALIDATIQPDVLVVDVNMPCMSGPEFMQKLRANPNTREIPAIGWSCSDRDRDIEDMYRYGLSGYLVKPLTFDGIYDAMHIVLEYWLLATPGAPTVPWTVRHAS